MEKFAKILIYFLIFNCYLLTNNKKKRERYSKNFISLTTSSHIDRKKLQNFHAVAYIYFALHIPMRTHPHSNQKFLHYESINQNALPLSQGGIFPVKVRPLNWILSRGERARNRGYARRNYSALPSTPSSAFTGNNHGSADSRLVIIIAPSVASLLRSSCVLRPRGWVLGKGLERMSRVHHRGGLNDSATIIASTERIIDGVVGERELREGFDLCGFFLLFFRGRLIVGGWPLFAMVFERGWDWIFFFCNCGRLGGKGGKDLVNGVRGF